MNRAGFLARIGGAVVAGLVGRKAVAEEPPALPDYRLTIGSTKIPVTGEALDVDRIAREFLIRLERGEVNPDNCITAAHIRVERLSAIGDDVGPITGGTISGPHPDFIVL